tara:strand:+ start:48 stop:245 length:198 start_codon:yes stop_codon:yes gene_type:complete
MKDKRPQRSIYDLVEHLEYDLVSLYSTGEILEWLEKDIEYVTMSLTAVMMDKSHFTALGMVIGEA